MKHILITCLAVLFITSSANAQATSYKDTVLADNPAGYWRLYESSGTVADDETSGNRDGTIGGDLTKSATGLLNGHTGERSIAIPNLNGAGSGQYITVANNAAFQPGTGAFSVEFWVRHTSTAGSWQVFTSKSESYQTRGWLVVRNSSNLRICAWLNNALRACAPSDYTTNTNYHIVFTRSGSNTIVYQNGVAGTTDTSLSSSYDASGSTDDLRFFTRSQFTSENHNFHLSDVAFYNTALTGTQVTTHYDCGSGGTSCVAGSARRRLLLSKPAHETFHPLFWFLRTGTNNY